MLCKQVPYTELLLNENQVREMRTQLCTFYENEQGEDQPAWRTLYFLGLHIKEKEELPILQERHNTRDCPYGRMCKSP